MTKKEIETILKNHQLWLAGKEGERTDLRGADLRWADLRWADLRGADLRWADLRGADLREADLRGADLDFSCWPLWCGTYQTKVDKRLAVQLAAHLCAVDCDDKDFLKLRNELLPFAREFHRLSEFPLAD